MRKIFFKFFAFLRKTELYLVSSKNYFGDFVIFVMAFSEYMNFKHLPKTLFDQFI